jgi:hypothetical protein
MHFGARLERPGNNFPGLFRERPGTGRATQGDGVKSKLMIAAMMAAMPLTAADAMNVAAFLEKAAVLEKKGMMALFSSDYKILKDEVQTASTQLRSERLAAQKAGKKPAYCPPAKGGLSPQELLTQLRTIPVPQRARMDVKDGLRTVLARKYPCPA